MHNFVVFSSVVKEPPYQLSESGYGSFNLPIEVYFKNKDEPKKVRFEYDLLLPNLNDPPINQIRSECLTFQNPSEDFKQKLVKAGGTSTGSSAPLSMPKVKRPGGPGGPGDDSSTSRKSVPKPKKKKVGGDSSGSDSSSDSESDDQSSTVATKNSKSSKKSSPNSWDTTSLKKLHKLLNSLQDPQQLQEIVNIIEQTGQYNLTASTFDFDLCKLDDHTLNKLSKFMDLSGTS